MARIKKKDYENLSFANIERVKTLLEPQEPGQKPITKKEACSLLNISYNTTRLARIIAEHDERKEYVAKRKAANRGKPASSEEIRQIVESYLEGDNIANIAKSLFRSPGFVKAVIERTGVPQRPTAKEGKTEVDILPESTQAESFGVGEIVWSAKYHRPAKVIKEYSESKKYLGKVYHIYVMESVDAPDSYFPHVSAGGFNAYQPAYDLGKLEHLQEYGVNLTRI